MLNWIKRNKGYLALAGALTICLIFLLLSTFYSSSFAMESLPSSESSTAWYSPGTWKAQDIYYWLVGSLLLLPFIAFGRWWDRRKNWKFTATLIATATGMAYLFFSYRYLAISGENLAPEFYTLFSIALVWMMTDKNSMWKYWSPILTGAGIKFISHMQLIQYLYLDHSPLDQAKYYEWSNVVGITLSSALAGAFMGLIFALLAQLLFAKRPSKERGTWWKIILAGPALVLALYLLLHPPGDFNNLLQSRATDFITSALGVFLAIMILLPQVLTESKLSQRDWSGAQKKILPIALVGGVLGGALGGVVLNACYGLLSENGLLLRISNGTLTGTVVGVFWSALAITPEWGRISPANCSYGNKGEIERLSNFVSLTSLKLSLFGLVLGSLIGCRMGFEFGNITEGALAGMGLGVLMGFWGQRDEKDEEPTSLKNIIKKQRKEKEKKREKRAWREFWISLINPALIFLLLAGGFYLIFFSRQVSLGLYSLFALLGIGALMGALFALFYRP